MLVRIAVPAVAFRRGDADESSLNVMKESVKESSPEEGERRKRTSPVVSVPIVFVGMFDESPVMVRPLLIVMPSDSAECSSFFNVIDVIVFLLSKPPLIL